MFTVSHFAKTSLLVLLAATLTTVAYGRGGGHSGSNGSTGASAPVHSSAAQSNARIGPAGGRPVVSKGKAYGCLHHGPGCGRHKGNYALDAAGTPLGPRNGGRTQVNQ